MNNAKRITSIGVMGVLTLSLASERAYGACEGEQREYDTFHGYCDRASGASQVLAPTILGGLLLGLVANNQCRIMGEKMNNFEQCLRRHAETQAAEAERRRLEATRLEYEAGAQAEEAERQRQLAEANAAREARAQEINARAELQQTQAREAAQQALAAWTVDQEAEGYAPTEAQVEAWRSALSVELRLRLAAIEAERAQQLSAL